ncbi:5-formyltetrahydrofolate cyclo-ligase [Clostridium tagluense]|uniref:5-formyltetrahydrofolate cyclo-ligase n=1 Tax=Clostridium tagluense TaxID=360422 RepID=UPI001CF49AAF|nr:5-formyltetrahydrofolate cyclo-ligase [Clostridium tagluense]MCB2311776.1 5-formyltetrahydrofolate cyclo-ligase [Clostridium tagluense]MCB2316502.1 5-formyltetrahydrofolate cyclo-ligase [Clostridium tagluense]MCB2321356.1 5-formyltetrahydrofolate cyclo-ligase [Clostridium tagluense]MCB2326371.1 5-formyltetrahydrofolate cyclo-ligase [Clostridium tagluense]MCB2331094.1 5-formyltetrahydrofolate cyclo-ligase [Clostridium tagluense]
MENNLKDNLRKNMLKERKSMKTETVSAFSHIIMDTIIKLPEFLNCKNIMLYLSFNNEVDTYALAKWCLDNGKKVIVPYCIKETREIIPFEINNLTKDLTKSSFGIMEPKHDILKKANTCDIDLIIVPGVVFDKHCNRIGFGAGYYDRFLPKRVKNTPTIGIAFDYQVISKIPTGTYDVPLDFIITEKRIIFPD